MNDIVASLGLEGLKPLADALLLPPLPLIALVLVAAWLLPRRRVLGWSLVLLACTGLWLTVGPGLWLVVGSGLVGALRGPLVGLVRHRVLRAGARSAEVVVVGRG